MYIPWFSLTPTQKNHGPVCLFECRNCKKANFFFLIAERLSFKLFWIMPIGANESVWSLRCSNCSCEMVITGTDVDNAVALNDYFANYKSGELSDADLKAIMAKYPLEAV